LALKTIEQFRQRPPAGTPQRQRGRYYSAMPTDLKAVCVTRFENYTRGL